MDAATSRYGWPYDCFWPKSAGGCQADFADSWRPTRASSSALRLGLLSYLKCIIDFDAEVSYCTFQLGMSQK